MRRAPKIPLPLFQPSQAKNSSKYKVNEKDIQWKEDIKGPFGHRRKKLSSNANGSKLGCSLFELLPGKKTFPFHYHTANEEAIYVLEGSGKLRMGSEDDIDVNAGDYITFPPTKDGAHQLFNHTSSPLKYLCFSTMIEPDITVYPDSGKVGLFAGSAPGSTQERTLYSFLKYNETDYYDGELDDDNKSE